MRLRLVGEWGCGQDSRQSQNHAQCECSPIVVVLREIRDTLRAMSGNSPALVRGGEGVVVPALGAGVSVDEAMTRWRDALSGEEKSIRTIDMYTNRVGQCAKWGGWNTVAQVSHESVLAFIAARKRNDHEGKPWDTGACRQAISACRSFGRFLGASGLVRPDPMMHLALPKKRAQRHKHPFTESEARGLVAASLARQARDKRAKGDAALVWATLFWTGLRHSEVQAPCKENPYGGLKWRDITLDGPFPGIWTDPRAIGNKSKTRDWLPLHPRLAELLRAHREMVMHRPEAPVFPIHPIRSTWAEDRARARLPEFDTDGRSLSIHATRATYCTWVGKLVLPEGLKDRLSRHHGNIAEWVYGERDREEMAAAIAQLPNIWPDLGGTRPTPPKKISTPPQNSVQALASANPIEYFHGGNQNDLHPPHKHDRTPGPAGCQISGSGSGFVVGARGPDGQLTDDGQPNPLTLISGLDLSRPDLVSTLKSFNLILNALASRASDKDRGDGHSAKDQSA